MIDESGVSTVKCTHMKNGDYVFQFPGSEKIIVEGNKTRKEIQTEIEFIQEIMKTPIVRRLLSSGTGNFMEFRRALTRKYNSIAEINTPE